MKRFLAISFLTLTLFVAGGPVFAPLAYAENHQAQQEDGAGGTGATTETTNPNANFEQLNSKKAGGAIGTVVTVFAWLLGVAAITLDNAVYYTVVTMGDYVNDLSAVGVAWRVLRDVGNIILIFGFLAAGLMTMLNSERYGAGKLIPKLLLVAVFLNFSLFISEAIIDTGNLFATQFYTAINGGKPAAPVSYSEFATEGISNTVLNQVGLQRIYADVRGDGRLLEGNHPLLIGFMSIILFMVAAFVFFSLAFILIARFVVLIVLIIVAPVGFVGWAIPQLEGKAKEWWEMLINNTLTAPVMLLMLYVALTVITDAQFLAGFGVEKGTAWTGLFVDESGAELADFAGILLSFMVAMGLLLLVTMLAKSLSAVGASWATKLGGAASFGIPALAGRYSLGRLSNAGSRFIRRTPLLQNEAGRQLLKLTDYGAKASFDVRSSKYAGQALGALKTDAGKPQEGGYRKAQEGYVKARTEYAKTLTGRDLTKEEKKKVDDLKVVIDGVQGSTKPEEQGLKKRVEGLRKEKERREEVKNDKAKNLTNVRQSLRDAQLAQQSVREQEDPVRFAELTTQMRDAANQFEAARTESVQADSAFGEADRAFKGADEELKNATKELEAVEKANKDIVGGGLAKKEYAEQLAASVTGKVLGALGPGWRANEEAAKKIKAELGKSSAQKALDAFKEEAKKEAEKESKPKSEDSGSKEAPH